MKNFFLPAVTSPRSAGKSDTKRTVKSLFHVGQKVEFTLLDSAARGLTAFVRDVAGRRLGLELPVPVQPGRALRVESGDAAFLGEVVWCHSEMNAHHVRVDLDQVLSGLAELGRLRPKSADKVKVRAASTSSGSTDES